MRVKYFSDTDTAHLEFLDNDVYETREISENIYVDLYNGNHKPMQIESELAKVFLQKRLPQNKAASHQDSVFLFNFTRFAY